MHCRSSIVLRFAHRREMQTMSHCLHPNLKSVSVLVERDQDTGLLVGHVPGIPGAHTQGETIDDILTNLSEVMEMLQEHTGVILKRPLPKLGLDSGSSGVVVHVHGKGAAYEVEFLTQHGHTVCVETIKPEDLAPAPMAHNK